MDFETLLQQAQKLTNITQGSDEFARVERTLPQVLQATHELHSRVTQTGAQDIQAHILLGSRGIELPKISQKLDALSARKTFEPLDPISDTDIQGFLKNEKENSILSVIGEVHRNSFQSAQSKKWDFILTDWRREKCKLMNALIGKSENWIDIRRLPEQTILSESIGGGGVGGAGRSSRIGSSSSSSIAGHHQQSNLTSHQMAYAREVFAYNRLVLDGSMRPSLVQKFAAIAVSQFNDTKVSEIWNIMKYMTVVPPFPRNQDQLQQRQHTAQFVEQAKRYLEDRYKDFMSTVIADHLRDAQRGGVPSTYHLVQAFVGYRFSNHSANSIMGLQDGHVEGRPLWPLVYYALRCGDVRSALRFVEAAAAGPGHEDFVQALEDKLKKPDQKMNTKLEGLIRMQYKRQIRNATDPYKRAVYCIIASCDVAEQHAEVAKNADDFLWIQLSMIRNADGGAEAAQGGAAEAAAECLTYARLQTMICEEYGEVHFNAAEQPHLYFQLLALTGQFEAAVEFLARFERYRTHAVHVALALAELGLLGGPRCVQASLLSSDEEDPRPLKRLNIARLVMLYVRQFEITDPAEALQYFYFLRTLSDPEGRNLFLVCVADLAIECRDYDLLFGRIQPGGMRSRGLIDQFESVNIDAKRACEMVAEELVKKGLFEDAIKLFDLAGIMEKALRYLSILLSQIVHQPSKKGSLRERLHATALAISQRYAGAEQQHCDAQTLSTFTMLRDLVTFFDRYHAGEHQAALQVLAPLQLVPLRLADMELCVHTFKRLGGEVSKVFPDLLLATMDILYTQYRALRRRHDGLGTGGGGSTAGGGGGGGSEASERQIAYIRDQAKALTTIAATVPYRMPGDTNSRLVQTEILMH